MRLMALVMLGALRPRCGVELTNSQSCDKEFDMTHGPIVHPVPPPSQDLPQAPLTGTSVDTAGVTGQSNNSVGVMGQCMGPAGSETSSGYTATSDGVYGAGKNGVHGQ